MTIAYRVKWGTIAFSLLILLPQKAFSVDEVPSTSPLRPAVLSRDMAVIRSKQIAQVSYQLWFRLEEKEKQFQGKTVVRFTLKPKANSKEVLKESGKMLALDLEGAKLESVSVNDKAIQEFSREFYDGHHLYFKMDGLQPTTNQIEIAYQHPYSTDGIGLHRFEESQNPEDLSVYLYTHFEPYGAHRVFPCFDQPDLKATYELKVDAPMNWQVISNTLPKEVKERELTSQTEHRKEWIFPPSPSFSTYLFALHAGPFASWSDDADGTPLRLFVRKSLSKNPHLDHKQWFKITKQGLNFFETQFGFAYPFGKYDQILVPDFNAGAMENVGAVTFSERFIHRTPVTQDQKRQLAETILHELAHQWFGDLVTMRWWNGLWLNESFATFASSWAADQATSLPGSWQSFFANSKQWAYWEDQLVTTHPISQSVIDTDAATANFDGITYGKGASVLKQLSFYLGEDDFREGLQRYFQKYAYKNSSISDFIKMMAEASSKDINAWEQRWLETSGVNSIRADWACQIDSETNKSKISQFDLIQTGELRPHKTQIALFQLPKTQHSALKNLGHPLNVIYQTAKTPVPDLLGKPCPDFVFPNEKDYDYVKVELDPISLKTISKHLSQMSTQIPDPLTRQMIWHSLWESVVDGKWQPQEYAQTALKQISKEKNSLIVSEVLRNLANSSANRSTILKFLEGKERERFQKKLEDWTKNQWLYASSGSDLQILWFGTFLEVAHSPSVMKWMKNLLSKKQKSKGLPRGFSLDPERRWKIVQTLARNGVEGIQELIDAELKSDPTDMGQKAAISAEALIPTAEMKQKWLHALMDTHRSLPLAKLREAMKNYQVLNQEEWTRASMDPYFEALTQLAYSSSIEDEEYSAEFAWQMFPSLCDPWVVEKTNLFLNSYTSVGSVSTLPGGVAPPLPARILKSLKVHRQLEERCIQTRKQSVSFLPDKPQDNDQTPE